MDSQNPPNKFIYVCQILQSICDKFADFLIDSYLEQANKTLERQRRIRQAGRRPGWIQKALRKRK